MRLAHRVYYEAAVGPVPAGLVLHHVCGRGADGCVNPAHLVPVTPAQNARLRQGVKLDPSRAAAIRAAFAAGGRSKSSLAREHGVTDVLIHYVVSDRCWKEEAA
jgi:hypothetical protein